MRSLCTGLPVAVFRGRAGPIFRPNRNPNSNPNPNHAMSVSKPVSMLQRMRIQYYSNKYNAFAIFMMMPVQTPPQRPAAIIDTRQWKFLNENTRHTSFIAGKQIQIHVEIFFKNNICFSTESKTAITYKTNVETPPTKQKHLGSKSV